MSEIRGNHEARQWRTSLQRGEGSFNLLCFAVNFVYLLVLVRPTGDEWIAFALSLVATVVVLALGLMPSDRALFAPLRRYLDALEEGSEEADVEEAYSAAMAYPWRFSGLRALSWLVGAGLLSLGMAAQGFSSWIFGSRFDLMCVYGLGGALICCGFAYFAARSGVAPLRRHLSETIPDASRRASLARGRSLASKLQIAFMTSLAGWLVVSVGISQETLRTQIDERALAWEERVLIEVERVRGDGVLETAAAQVMPHPDLRVFPLELSLVSDEDSTLPQRVREDLARHQMHGQVRDFEAGRLLSWRRAVDGQVLVASIAERDLDALVAAPKLQIAALLALALAGAFVLARLLGKDVHGAISALAAEAERVASGDLRPGAPSEADDELAELSGAFDRMREALRTTVARVSETADRVDASVAGIADVGRAVSAQSVEQASQIRHAGELMDRINAEVSGITRSSRGLGESVEESGSSILELGAASEQLNETASVLSEKIESVSSSIEQMVRSNQQVSQNAGQLAEAANNTSEQMEEMSSAMRVVDTTAGRSASLSTDVLEAAERGHDKVRQTIEGMHEIQDATDAAEKVIRGLGSRAKEIGAILDVIEDVGDETTLLALNAAIIAAQAGEQGRAFSVVADEIKELAERVLASAKEIGGLIRSVQDEVGNAIGAIEAGSNSVSSGVDLSAEAGGALEDINRAAQESGSRIGEIVSAVRGQATAAVGVVELMDQVRDGVIEIRAAGVEQGRGHDLVLNSSLAIRDVAQQVRRTTEEQTAGFGRIRVSVEAVQDAAEKINASLAEQSEACGEVARFIDEVADRTRLSEDAMSQIGGTVESLATQAEALREDMARFRV